MSTITSYGEITLTDLREPFVVLLSNEVQQFVTDVNRKASVAQSFYTDVKVFQGNIERTDYIIGTITNANNITVAKTSSRITFSVFSGTVIGADSGTFTIPITLDNNTINKTFSWSCSKQGSVGATGKGISSTETTYQVSNDGTTAPTGTWEKNIPTISPGQYLWTKTVFTYTDKTTSTVYSVGRNGTNGKDGVSGKGIKNTEITYQVGTSGTTSPTGTWNKTIPTVNPKEYLWTRTVITYTDDTSSTSYSVGMMGANGKAGADAKSVQINSSTQYFKSVNGGVSYTPDTITLTPIFQGGITYLKWQYSLDGGRTWTDVNGSTNGVSVSTSVLTLKNTSTLFTDKISSIPFKCLSNNTSYYDVMTIAKLYDPEDVEIGGRNLLLNSQTLSGYTITEQ